MDKRQVTQAGVTLVEVMIIVIILGIGAAMAVPNYLASTARAQLRQAVTELHGNLGLARMIAMNRNTTVTVTLSQVACPPATSDCGRVLVTFTTVGGGAAMTPQVMPAEVRGVGGTSQIQFSSLGLRLGNGPPTQSMQLTNTYGVTYEIQVSSAGLTRWCAASPCPPF